MIQSHPDPGVVGKFLRPDLGLVAGSDAVLGALARSDPGGFDRAWCERVARDWRAWRDRATAEPQVDGGGIHPARLSALLEEAMPLGTTFVTSHGNVDFWADPVLRITPPSRYLRAGQSGALGAEIPFGVAAKLASPATTVVVIVGDGGFAFHGLELETALRYGAPIVVVVYDDEKWGAIALPSSSAPTEPRSNSTFPAGRGGRWWRRWAATASTWMTRQTSAMPSPAPSGQGCPP